MKSCDCNDSLCDEIEKFITHEIHLTLLNTDLRANWFLKNVNLNQNEFMKFKNKILDSLNEYQQKTMTVKVFLVKLKKKDI